MGNGRPKLMFLYDGVMYSVTELADMAGCTKYAMRARLMKMTPESAVARGPNPKVQVPKYEYLGTMYTAAELAQIAGSSEHAMYLRLTYMSPAEAVRKGKESTHKNYGRNEFFEYKGYTLTAGEIAKAERVSLVRLNNALDTSRTVEEAIRRAKEEK